MTCLKCGTQLKDDVRFCVSCGALVSRDVVRTEKIEAIETDQFVGMLRAATAGVYEIQDELGRGGMGAVYRAVELSLGRLVAIKVLPPEFAFDPKAAERFRREARTSASLDHPNIIPVYRVGEGGRLLWYAMKYLEGQSLGDRLEERGPLPLDETITILAQVADALDYAHERGITHRDMKPPNVMLDRRGRAIVTDFGIAKARGAGTLTALGGPIGTPPYMAPEQWFGNASGAADLYSVAVMTCLMLSGRLPFDAQSIPEMMQQHISMDPPVDHLMRAFPPGVAEVLRRGLAKSPDQRQASVSEFVHGLRQAAVAPIAPPRQPPAPVPAPAAAGMTRWEAARGTAKAPAPKMSTWPFGAAMAGLVLIAVVALVLTRDPQVQTLADVPPPAPPTAAAPVTFSAAALDRAPRLNRGTCSTPAALLGRRDPGGRVEVEFVVNMLGVPEPASLTVKASTNHAVDGIAVNSLIACRFKPGIIGGQPVQTLVSMPVTVPRASF